MSDMKRKRPTAEYVRSRLGYDVEAGILTWKLKPVTKKQDIAWNKIYGGTTAGYANGHGGWPYIMVNLDYHMYHAHDMIWLMMTGEWPEHAVDHVDGNGLNNKFLNLRAATLSQNQWNRRAGRNNKSGFKGVWWDSKKGKWAAGILKHRKSRWLGYYQTPEEAAEAYRQAAIELHGEFARFE